jgi:hypothetical protein
MGTAKGFLTPFRDLENDPRKAPDLKSGPRSTVFHRTTNSTVADEVEGPPFALATTWRL